jgi:hypothetical protein
MKMKTFALSILMSALLSSPAAATTYFLAPNGNDSNSGTSSSSPWLSPNHTVNCGDVITAAASTSYSPANFGPGKWGTVSCPAGNNVAWLKCETFDACKINTTTSIGMWISKNYWGVQGWEISATGSFNSCFLVAPPNSGASTIHHIVLANNIADGCGDGGLAILNEGNAGVDYIAMIGNIAYDAAQDSSECYSGINIVVPAAFDSAAGTHIYVAGNLSYDNLDPNPCAGGSSTDGEGIILDTISGKNYNQQIVVENNIVLFNGGRGIQPFDSMSGAPIYIRHNTAYGNETQSGQRSIQGCGEIGLNQAPTTQVIGNLTEATVSTGCGGSTVYAYKVDNGNGTDVVNGNWGFSSSGNTFGTSNSPGFSFGTNTSSNPSFTNPINPGAPNCGSSSSAPGCMATVIANFTPQLTAAKAYGYQVPLTSDVVDPLFPAWLCNVGLPSGLVTMGCTSTSSLPSPPTNVAATVQ